MGASLNEMREFLEKIRIPLRLASQTKTGWPMVISLWFLHRDDLLYCATRKSAKIITYLQNDARCAFEIAADQPPYCGVRGQARARIDHDLGGEILEQLLIRYLEGTDNALATKLLAKRENEVAIVLEPVRIFIWNYSDRMVDLGAGLATQKICP